MRYQPALSVRTSIAVALLVSSAAALTWHYTSTLTWPQHGDRVVLHDEIIAGEAVAPHRYRVLVPWAMELSIRALSTVIGRGGSFAAAYAMLDFIAMSAALVLLYLYLRRWAADIVALVLTLFVTGTLSITLQDHFFQPWSFPELAFFSLALLLILDDRRWSLAALVVVATLNRETGVFIPVAFALAFLSRDREAREAGGALLSGAIWTGFYGAIWLALFVALRVMLGTAEPHEPLSQTVAINMEPRWLVIAIIQLLLILGFGWVLAVRGLKSAPRFLRAMTLVLPLYLVPVLIWGRWTEIRLMLPMLPIILPLAAIALTRHVGTATPDENNSNALDASPEVTE